jgi:ferredoxin
MTSDDRITSGFIHDILDALERHGYTRGDDLHAGRAIGLIGDLARICEGTQDAPPSGDVVVLSSQPAAPQSPGPFGQDAVLVSAGQVKTLLAALDDAAEYKRDRAETCADCAGQSCTTCQWRLQAAEAYDQMADRLIHAAEASATRHRASGHAAPPGTGPHAAADKEAGQ